MARTLPIRGRRVWEAEELDLPGLRLLGHSITTRARRSMPRHVHEGALEFVALVRGNESYEAEGEQVMLSGGDVFVSFAGQPHGNGDAPQGVSEFIWFQIDPRPDDLMGLSPARADGLRRRLLALDTHRLKADRECLFLLKSSVAGFLEGGDASRVYAQSLLASALFRLLSPSRPAPVLADPIEPALACIEACLNEPLPLERLSGLCGLSISGFKHRFKQVTGRTPRDYVNRAKVRRAMALLREGRSVTGTAMELGFGSSDYFSVVFKKYTAMTPSRYAALGRRTGQ